MFYGYPPPLQISKLKDNNEIGNLKKKHYGEF